MHEEDISFSNRNKEIFWTEREFEGVQSECNGMKNTWSCKVNPPDSKAVVNFVFDWTELQKKGAYEIYGRVYIKMLHDVFKGNNFSVFLQSYQPITTLKTILPIRSQFKRTTCFSYDFCVKYDTMSEEQLEGMFGASGDNDAVLVVEEKKLHVNKTFLSLHSEYFRRLFAKNQTDRSINTFEVPDIFVQLFARMIAVIHPKVTIFPNDSVAFSILSTAQKLEMPTIKIHVEHHLLHNSKIRTEQLIWMADIFGMPLLLKKELDKLVTEETLRTVKLFSKYDELSADVKAKIEAIVVED